jgi:asparagine synthase (glutamine-hydrolysing)
MELPEDEYDRQPLGWNATESDSDASLLVADLRIDNRAELRRILRIPAEAAAVMADSALLQAAWREWGDSCPERLAGDFAFAVWEPGRQRLILVRDHFGRRPLHYTENDSLFAFASLPTGIVAFPTVARKLDPTMLVIRLALFPECGERTFFQGVQRVPPGHMVVVDRNGIVARPYWKPDVARQLTYRKDSDYVEGFQTIFEEAVRCRLRATGATGCMLSGGFDSSSVTAMAATVLAAEGRMLTAFTSVPSAGFAGSDPPGRFGNEGPHAASVAAMYPNVRHVLVEPAQACSIDLLASESQTTPGVHPCMAPIRKAMGDAFQERGITSVLTGANGNLTISYDGLPLLSDLLRRFRWARWAKEAQGLRVLREASWRSIVGNSLLPLMPRPVHRIFYETGKLSQHSMIHPDFIRSGEILRILESARNAMGKFSLRDGRGMRAAGFWRRDNGGDGPARPGVRGCDPTSDIRLVNFCLAVPDEQFLRLGQRRFLLRRAMAGRLPRKILDERRKGLGGADWYLGVAPYRDRLAEAVARAESSAMARHFLDVQRMRRLIDEWPKAGWDTRSVGSDYRLALLRGLAVSEFICREEGRF